MTKIIEFRVITQLLEKAVISVTRILRANEFKVLDLRESEVVSDSDGSLVSKVYVLCCQGREQDYQNFKVQQKMTEIIYEGFKTLM